MVLMMTLPHLTGIYGLSYIESYEWLRMTNCGLCERGASMRIHTEVTDSSLPHPHKRLKKVALCGSCYGGLADFFYLTFNTPNEPKVEWITSKGDFEG